MKSHRVRSSPAAIAVRLGVLVQSFALLIALMPSAAQTKTEQNADKDTVLQLIGTSAVIARKLHAQSLVGYVAIYVSESNRTALLGVSDIGPFLRFKEGNTSQSTVVLMSGIKDYVFCSYFNGKSPVGTMALPPPGKTKITVEQVAKAYQTVDAGLVNGPRLVLHFAEGNVTTDDGQPVPSYRVIGEEPKRDE